MILPYQRYEHSVRGSIMEMCDRHYFPPRQPLPRNDTPNNPQPWGSPIEWMLGGWPDLYEAWCWFFAIPFMPGQPVDQTPAWSPALEAPRLQGGEESKRLSLAECNRRMIAHRNPIDGSPGVDCASLSGDDDARLACFPGSVVRCRTCKQQMTWGELPRERDGWLYCEGCYGQTPPDSPPLSASARVQIEAVVREMGACLVFGNPIVTTGDVNRWTAAIRAALKEPGESGGEGDHIVLPLSDLLALKDLADEIEDGFAFEDERDTASFTMTITQWAEALRACLPAIPGGPKGE